MDHRMGVYQALILLVSFLSPTYAFIAGIDGPLVHQEALEDGNTNLICDTTPDIVHDEIMLLVWYKGDESIYSYDARSGTEWSSRSFNINGRVTIDINKHPVYLFVSKLKADDQAVYHCRVEFLLSPTKYTGVNLIVIVRPSKPFFLDELGNKVENKIGPYFEGDTLMVTCLVIGGRPPPQISWYSGDVLVDATGTESDIPNVRENELYLPLARDTPENVSCVASNSKQAAPETAVVHIELYLSAENVSINWIHDIRNGSLQVGKSVVVQCIADGVYPSPEIAWWLNDKHLTQYSNQTYDRITKRAVSYLQLTPMMADDGATLACMATSLGIPQGRNSKADVITLNVTYAPTVEISVLNTSDQTVIENKILTLHCEVKANPPADRFVWYFNGVRIDKAIFSAYDIKSNMLTVQKVTRAHAGQYSCTARNNLGKTNAEPIDITVAYPPECSEGIILRGDKIICNVKAVPVPTKYSWRMQSDTQIQLFTSEIATMSLSEVTLPLDTALNVSCNAENGVHSQQKVCTRILSFKHLRPQPLQQCDLGYYDDQFQIRCLPVDNATHYDVSVWRTESNASLTFVRKRILGFVKSQVRSIDSIENQYSKEELVTNEDDTITSAQNHFAERQLVNENVVKGGLGSLSRDDEAGVAACNRFGCSTVFVLRPTERLLNAVAAPWWKFLLDKNVGISIGGVLLAIVFVTSTILIVFTAKRTCSKPAPVIQVLQIDDMTRDFLNSTRDLKARSSCTLRSRSIDYLEGTEELDLTTWQQDYEPPPDVTITMLEQIKQTRESAV